MFGIKSPDYQAQNSESQENTAILVFKLICIAFFILMGALFSGLNLGLLSLDRINLQILNDLGTEKDKKRVKKIM
ncbi:MAG: hypothetical protein EZS28_028349 [Streblomastix strix]|uniref:CNNM transmembrane domain-containing protein n=1 Tax=Streblomastix strix TaxID=222440 RepID=A0A5J4V0U1_9EUKA|nr:MAG: hypothetical protein EZS28_028349 [Streblomastix strix]